jgi:hypothetical protein
LVQEVATRVRYLCGEVAVVDYSASYGEFFSMGKFDSLMANNDELLDMRDVHDFDLRRDGWSLSGLQTLLRHNAIKDADGRAFAGQEAARITCEKRFLLAPGRIEDTAPAKQNHSQSFGFLCSGPRSAATARIDMSGGTGGTRLARHPDSPFPFGCVGRGSGTFEGNSAYLLVETFAFSFATDSLRFEDGDGYHRVDLADIAGPA